MGGVPAPKEGDLVGLVGYQNGIPYFDVKDGKLVNTGKRFQIVMHPALVGLELGHSTSARWDADLRNAPPALVKKIMSDLPQHRFGLGWEKLGKRGNFLTRRFSLQLSNERTAPHRREKP